MFGKILKFATAGTLLGFSLYYVDFVFWKYIGPKAPAKIRSLLYEPSNRGEYVRFVALGLSTVALAPVAFKLVGLSKHFPIKPDQAPVNV